MKHFGEGVYKQKKKDLSCLYGDRRYQIYCGNHFVVYININPYCTPELI